MDTASMVGLELYADLFSARQDAYVKDSRAHINEPITVALIVDAMTNKWAVSGYTARVTDDGRVLTHVGAIDFDHAPDEAPEQVRETLRKLGVPTLLSKSRRGAHLWVVLHSGDGTGGSEKYGQVPASAVRRALEHAIRLTDAALLSQCEVFPKASSSAWGVGALRFPLMSHPKTHLRYPVFDMAGNRLTKLADVVSAVEYADWPVIQRLSAEAPVEYPRDLGTYRKVVNRREVGSAVALLAQLGVTAMPGHSCRCPFHGDKKASLSVATDDERVWCKSPECEAYNGGRGVGTLALVHMVQAWKAK